MKKPRITTLWDVVSSLQSNLEGYGLEEQVVDAAVVVGVESMLGPPRREARRNVERQRRRFAPLLGFFPIHAKA